MNITKVLTSDYENISRRRRAENKPKQTQFHPPFRALSPSTNPQIPKANDPIYTAYTPVSIRFSPVFSKNTLPTTQIVFRMPAHNQTESNICWLNEESAC
jgi:hypothetical protein